MFVSFTESDNENEESEHAISEAEPVDEEPEPCTSGTQKQTGKPITTSPASNDDSGPSMPTLETDLQN